MTEPTDQSHREFVGPIENYDVSGALQFNLLTSLGLRSSHRLLDVGCGSLRAGKLFIPFLEAGNYHGIEPEQWLLDKAIEFETGNDLVALKQPKFSNDSNYTFSLFNTEFDFIVAQSIFSHTAQTSIERAFSEARQCLAKNGVFAATFMIGPENYTGDKWVYPGCVTYSEVHIQALANQADLEATKLDWPHPNGQTWFAITHPDKSSLLPKTLGGNERLRLEQRIDFLQKRIEKYQSHPYVKFGMQVNVILQPVFSLIRKLIGK